MNLRKDYQADKKTDRKDWYNQYVKYQALYKNMVLKQRHTQESLEETRKQLIKANKELKWFGEAFRDKNNYGLDPKTGKRKRR